MNNERRQELDRATALIEEAQQIIETVKDGEQEAFDNLGENFQSGERGQKMEGAIEALDEANDSCEGVLVSLVTAKE